VKYADVPPTGLSASADTFTYRLRGNVGRRGGPRVDRHASLEGDRGRGEEQRGLPEARGRPADGASLASSEAEAQIAVRNPFAFPLKIAEMQYTLIVNGQEVGQGATRGMQLHPAQTNVLALPIEVDHAGLLSAAGRALLSGGEVAARLHGKLVIRLKGGDLTVPLDLSGHLTDAS
jgi:hypothetical protein